MKIQEYLDMTGIKPSWLAKKVGISGHVMWKIRKGYRPSLPIAYMIQEVTKGAVTADELRRGDDVNE